jgi:hypothetical protein
MSTIAMEKKVALRRKGKRMMNSRRGHLASPFA